MNKLKIHPRDLEENRLVLARAEKLHRETTGYIREQIDSRVQYFNYYLGRQDVLSINKGRKQLNLFLDYVEEQCLQEAAFEGTADGFPGGMRVVSRRSMRRIRWITAKRNRNMNCGGADI